MNDPLYEQLRETAWKRPLTDAESAQLQAWLDAHPAAKADWDGEAALNRLLESLPAAPPVSSNFTSQVMRAVAQQAGPKTTPHSSVSALAWVFQSWLRRALAACLVIGMTLFAWHGYQLNARNVMARQVSEVAGVADALYASNPDIIEHFDSIRRLSDTPPAADVQLISLMQ